MLVFVSVSVLAISSSPAAAHITRQFGNLSVGTFSSLDEFSLSYYQATSHSLAVLIGEHNSTPSPVNGKCWRASKKCVQGKWRWGPHGSKEKTYVGCTTDGFGGKGWCGTHSEVRSGQMQYKECRLGDCRTLASYSRTGEPWWWLIAEPAHEQSLHGNESWSHFAKNFNGFERTLQERTLERSWRQWLEAYLTYLESWLKRFKRLHKVFKPLRDNQHDNSRIWTNVYKNRIAMRAYPKRYCAGDLRTVFRDVYFMRALSIPPFQSEVDRLLPEIREGKCLVEIQELEKPDTLYHVKIFSIEDGSRVPATPPPPFATFFMMTKRSQCTWYRKIVLFYFNRTLGIAWISVTISFCVSVGWLLGQPRFGEARQARRAMQRVLDPEKRRTYAQLMGNTSDKEDDDSEHASEEDQEKPPKKDDSCTWGMVYTFVVLCLMFVPAIWPIGFLSAFLVYPFIWPARMIACPIEVENAKDASEWSKVQNSTKHVMQFVSNVLSLSLNFIVIPFNFLQIHIFWLAYIPGIYSVVDFLMDNSYSDFYNKAEQFNNTSEWELAGLIPCMAVSVCLFAIQAGSYTVKKTISEKKEKRAETLHEISGDTGCANFVHLLKRAFPVEFRDIVVKKQLSPPRNDMGDNDMEEGDMEEDDMEEDDTNEDDPEDDDTDEDDADDDVPCSRCCARCPMMCNLCWYALIFILSLVFACVPHICMCWRFHADHLPDLVQEWPSFLFQQTLWTINPSYLYILNVTGVTYRFVVMYNDIMSAYMGNISQMAAFHAITIRAEELDYMNRSKNMEEWFKVEKKNILQKRTNAKVRLKKFEKLEFRMSNMNDIIRWYALRKYIMRDIQDERLVMQMFLLVTLSLTFCMTVATYVANIIVRRFTIVFIVALIVAMVGAYILWTSLSCARTINNMVKEHGHLIRNLASDMEPTEISVAVPDQELRDHCMRQFLGKYKGKYSDAMGQQLVLQGFADRLDDRVLPETILGREVDDTLFAALTYPVISLVAGSLASFLLASLNFKF